MKKRYKILTVLVVIVLIMSVIIGFVIRNANEDLDTLVNEPIPTLDLSLLSDDFYTGSYETLMIKVTVKVEVINHEIISIEILEHVNGRGDDAEVIINDVLRI